MHIFTRRQVRKIVHQWIVSPYSTTSIIKLLKKIHINFCLGWHFHSDTGTSNSHSRNFKPGSILFFVVLYSWEKNYFYQWSLFVQGCDYSESAVTTLPLDYLLYTGSHFQLEREGLEMRLLAQEINWHKRSYQPPTIQFLSDHLYLTYSLASTVWYSLLINYFSIERSCLNVTIHLTTLSPSWLRVTKHFKTIGLSV